jgi:hypothetical protein
MNKSIWTLKDAIKDKKWPVFDHIPANTLVLWNVSASPVRTHMEKPGSLDLPDELSLLAMDRLSKVFSGVPEEGHLHILVKLSMSGECMSCKLTISF